MIQKTFEMSCKQGKIYMNHFLTSIVSSLFGIIIHSATFEQKFQLRGTLKGGGWYDTCNLKHMYLNDFTEFECKISYMILSVKYLR